MKGSLLILSTSSLPRKYPQDFTSSTCRALPRCRFGCTHLWNGLAAAYFLVHCAAWSTAHTFITDKNVLSVHCDADEFGGAHTCLFDGRHCLHLLHPLPCSRQPTGAKHSCRRAPYRPVILPAPSLQLLAQRRLMRKALPMGRPRGVRGSSLVSGSVFRV